MGLNGNQEVNFQGDQNKNTRKRLEWKRGRIGGQDSFLRLSRSFVKKQSNEYNPKSAPKACLEGD